MLPVENSRDLAVYIHWPFCKFKCPYCDFNSHVRDHVDHADWQAAYLQELVYYRDLIGARHVTSIFFGGGTPSLMQPQTVAAVIDQVAELWGLPQGAEITLEANPTSIETQKLRDFKAASVNRVSLGVQSLHDADLKKLGRQHSAAEALAAVDMAASIFDRFSFDLMYARQGQTARMWREELAQALPRTKGHLSLYQLTIEEGTQFKTLFERGEISIPSEDVAADMYEITQEMTEKAGLPSYEISNHARLGDESRHNLSYWRYRDYVGIGPGAHGRLTLSQAKKYATRAHRAPEIWLERVKKDGHGAHPFEEIGADKRATEMLMMGLRTVEGVSAAGFLQETGHALFPFLATARMQALIDGGFLTHDEKTLSATLSGRQRLNGLLNFLLNG